MLIIDSKMRNIEKEKLRLLGYDLYEIAPNSNLYFEISSHVDIHCVKINNYIIGDKCLNYTNIIYGNSILKNKYPFDIPYNICIVGNFAIHNFKYTDTKILEILEKENFRKINIKQGYSKCSIAVIDDNSVIVTDTAIAQTLKEYGFDVLLISEKINQNIHLYKNSNLEYSTMHGFIGGCISRIDDYIFISGDLNKIDFDNKIKNFIENKNLKIIDFPNLDIVDYGGILKI